jgi:hypothetical protein
MFEYGQSHELPVTAILKSMEYSTGANQASRERHQKLMAMINKTDSDHHPIQDLEAAIKQDQAETLKSFFEQRSTELPMPEAAADSTMTGPQIIGTIDLPSRGEQSVYEERDEPPGKTSLTTTEPIEAHIETSLDCSGVTEYIPDIVSASPTEDDNRQRRSARRMPRFALMTKKPRFGPPARKRTTKKRAFVIPAPRTDTESEMESTPVSPQGRPVRSGKATARA